MFYSGTFLFVGKVFWSFLSRKLSFLWYLKTFSFYHSFLGKKNRMHCIYKGNFVHEQMPT